MSRFRGLGRGALRRKRPGRQIFRARKIQRTRRGFTSLGELKFHDVTLDDAVVAAVGEVILDSLVKIPQNITEITRIGRKATIRKISVRMQYKIPSTATAANTSDIMRVILFHDKQANGATAAVLDILETADYQSFLNLSNSGRFRILFDKTIPLICQAGSGRGTTDTLSFSEDTKVEQWHKECNISIEYDSTAGAITEIKSNNLGVLIISSDGLCEFQSSWRLRFTDL